MWTDEQITQYADDRPSLETKMSDEIDWTMELADDPDYAAQVRGWES